MSRQARVLRERRQDRDEPLRFAGRPRQCQRVGEQRGRIRGALPRMQQSERRQRRETNQGGHPTHPEDRLGIGASLGPAPRFGGDACTPHLHVGA